MSTNDIETTCAARLKRAWRITRSLWRDMTGESAYERYVERHKRAHPDHPPMSEKEFWLKRSDEKNSTISTGCC